MFVFGAGVLIGTQLQDAAGNAIATPTPVRLGTMQEVSGDFSFEKKTLYGANQFAVAIGRGKAKLAFKAKAADINGAMLSSLLFGQAAAAGIKAPVIDFAAAVPSTPYQVTIAPPNAGTFVADLGVVNAATGATLTRVASAPATGQYSLNVATGIYTFAAADTTNNLLISYEYSSSSSSGQVLSITNQAMGLAPSFSVILLEQYLGKKMALKLNFCISDKLSMPFKYDDFSVPEFDFEAAADAAGNVGYLSLF